MQPLPHILIVDDDERLRELLQQFLSDQGFFVSAARNTAQARLKMSHFQFDALVLDVMMPEETGLEFAASLSGQHPPILMLTALGETQDRIKGLETGVDDYLVKPFEPRELTLRLRNIMRRFESEPEPITEINFGVFRFDIPSTRLFKGDEQIYLTSSESACLKTLAQHNGNPISREKLAELTTGSQEKSNERSVDVQINRLRKKIEPVPGRPVYIQTVRGAGYILHADG